MAILQRMMIALLSVAMLAAGAVNATSTTNFSDQWWNEVESGWGVSVLQQADVLFITLGVYGADNKPTWFTGAAFKQSGATPGHTLFTGDLYQTNGPYHGGSFNTSSVTYVTVGTLTFDAATANDATLTYSVDGRWVVKNVTRQLWRYENLTGKYGGFWHTECSSGLTQNEPLTLTVTHNADNSVVGRLDSVDHGVGYYVLFRGTYSQSGHMGQIVAHMQAPDKGTVTFSEIEWTPFGFVGRVSGDAQGCQAVSGRIAAVLQ